MPQSLPALLVIAAVIFGAILLASVPQFSSPPPETQLVAAVPIQNNPLTVPEREALEAVKTRIIVSDGHDYNALYELLSRVRGNLDKIYAICTQVNPVFCYKRASEQNPTLRQAICVKMVLDLSKKYGPRVSGSNHQRECLLGIPAYAY